MAPRLRQNEKTSATVHVLKPRKAKGAGGAKRSGKPVNRLKTPEHAAKPAPPAARQPTDSEVRRNAQDRLVALHSNHKSIENKMAAASEVVAELRTRKAEVRSAIQNIVPLAVYEELHKKLALKTKRSDNEAYEAARALAFEAFALPCGPAAELDLTGKMPEPAKADVYWEEVGYRVAVDGAGQFADPQRDGVPAENVQSYMRGHQRGTERIGAGLKALEAEPEKTPDLPPAGMPGQKVSTDALSPENVKAAVEETGDGQPDWTGFDEDPDMWSDAQRETFRDWFDSVQGDVDIEHPGVEKAFDEAVEAETKGE